MRLERAPAVLLRLEGAAVLGAALALYGEGGWSWAAFALVFLAPDLSLLAYLAGTRAGMVAYDLVHWAALPVVLGAAGVVAGAGLPVQLALIWLAHIGIDHLLGYGLKYPSAFRDTHLQRV